MSDIRSEILAQAEKHSFEKGRRIFTPEESLKRVMLVESGRVIEGVEMGDRFFPSYVYRTGMWIGLENLCGVQYKTHLRAAEGPTTLSVIKIGQEQSMMASLPIEQAFYLMKEGVKTLAEVSAGHRSRLFCSVMNAEELVAYALLERPSFPHPKGRLVRVSVKDLVDSTHVSNNTVRRGLDRLMNAGKIARVRNNTYVIFEHTEDQVAA